jgi:hypothetical protein
VIGGQGRNRTTDTWIFRRILGVRSTSPWHAELRWNKYLVEAGFSRLAVVTLGFAPVCNPGVTPASRHVVTVSFALQQNFARKSALPSHGTRATYYDTEVLGLQLRVTDRAVKSFCVFRRSECGNPERITIGRFPTLSIEQAHAKANRYLADLGGGISVGARLRNETITGKTLGEVHQEYLVSRGVSITTIKRKGGKSLERPQLGREQHLERLQQTRSRRTVARRRARRSPRPAKQPPSCRSVDERMHR